MSFREGDIRVIRPLVYVREKDLRSFAETQGLPVIAENCPACFDAPTVSFHSSMTNAELWFINLSKYSKHAFFGVHEKISDLLSRKDTE